MVLYGGRIGVWVDFFQESIKDLLEKGNIEKV